MRWFWAEVINYKQRSLLALFSKLLVLITLWLIYIISAQAVANELIDDEPIILELHLARRVLNEAVLVYPREGTLLIPLGELSRSLKLAIDVDLGAGVAEGWFIREDQSFSLDLARNEVIVNDDIYILSDADYLKEFDDIYIKKALIEEWFPIDLDLKLSDLALYVNSRTPLPLEQQIEREKRARNLSNNSTNQATYPLIEGDYQWLSFPLMDITLDTYLDSNNRWDTDYSVFASGDLAKLTSEFYLAGSLSEGSVTSSRWSLGRRHPEDTGILGTTEFQIGDVFTPSIEHLSSSSEGRGVYLANTDLSSATEFDRTTLRGSLTTGWEVELYVNNQLISMQTANDRNDGLYEFSDVNLLFGRNEIKLVFYGPEGQQQEQVDVIYIGSEQLSPGKWSYQVGVNQADVPVIDLTSVDQYSDPNGELHFSTRLEYGVSQNLTMNFGYVSLYDQDDRLRQNMFSIGATGGFWGLYNQVNWLVDNDQNNGLDWQLQTRLLSTNVNLKHLEFWGLDTQDLPRDVYEYARQSEVRLDDSFGPLGLSLTVGREELEQRTDTDYAKDQYSVEQRTSLSTSYFQTSNTLNYDLYYSRESQFSGDVALTKRLFDWTFRTSVDYDLEPESNITSYSVDASWRSPNGYSVGIDTSYDTENESTDYGFRVSKRYKNIDFGIEANGDDEGDYDVHLSMAFSVGYVNKTNHLYVRSDTLATTGGVEVRAFNDSNGNGIFDSSEQLLSDIAFNNGKATESGVLLMTDLSTTESKNIYIDDQKMQDPYLYPTIEGLSALGRPGIIQTFDYPFIATGEVDGDAYLFKNGEFQPIAGAKIQLVDQKGRVISERTSEYDGFFFMDKVPLGDYRLRVDPEQVQRLNLKPIPEHQITLQNSGDFVGPIRIELVVSN
ncbi:hypothetical protein BCU75_18610 [Vibrio splendidus]|nr:hypothetical protein BCU75_18610 [Vibrio splendidus]